MAEYIEKEKLMAFPIRIDHYDEKNGNLQFVLGIESVLEYAENLPTVDAEPVRHGKWIPIIDRPTWACAFHKLAGYQCSLCGRIEKENEPYCNCGAKMDGDK